MTRTTRVTKTLAAASVFGAAALAAPAAQAADKPSMDVMLTGQVNGQTLTVQYADKGVQYQVDDGSKTLTRQGAMAFSVDYGDGSKGHGYDGTGALTCLTDGPLAPFSDSVSSGYDHRYKKPGTYTVTATGSYCGEGGVRTVTKKYKVTIGAPAPAATVSATPHLDYTVKGLTATISPWISGTQHFMKDGRRTLKVGVPQSYDVLLPEGVTASSELGANMGRPTCTNKGSYEFDPVLLTGEPVVLTFPKPGTYKVTLRASVCTDQHEVSKTVMITVPAGGKPTTPPTKPTHPTHPTTPGASTHPTRPGTSTHPTHPATPTYPGTSDGTASATSAAATHTAGTPGVGPKVETDQAGDGTQNLTVGLAALAGAGVIGGGLVAARRRTQG